MDLQQPEQVDVYRQDVPGQTMDDQPMHNNHAQHTLSPAQEHHSAQGLVAQAEEGALDQLPPNHVPLNAVPQEATPPQGAQEQVAQYHAAQGHEAQKHVDQAMDGVDDSSMNTTITAASVAPMPDFSQSTNSYTPEPHRPSTSYSDTAYQYTTHNGPRFNASSDADTPPRHGYYDANKETHMGQSHSRPSSQMGRYPASDSGSRSNSYQDQNQRGAQQQQEAANKNASVVIKVGMVGDAQIGKTSLMVKYVEGSWDEDYIQTLGVNFMEKTISIRNTEITFSIWDLGGQREFVNMLPLVCNDAVAILFMFDLTRKSTLNSIKEWYRQGRGFNKTAIPFLVGTKYDHFVNFPREEQEEISNQAKRFARAMKASLIFSSTSHSINIFKIVLSKAFDLKCTIPEIENVGEPLLLYQAV
ncbi:P-loop containing nucleoside triphosphate hydrolase protein [Plenodomus tracheiphilus IPT5]|uniref:P-loop containing nucleoside triphosphate hydrolase protein n=1 Tax=Plenodomus tracheiphilus IPT5 TaxID=1408161 RepID=A0A6A7B7U8_9PLEO|nr:P-loop containing nucleoside triphosphate hydrolase protein [Plenodomus tracheiphilus IPT5]